MNGIKCKWIRGEWVESVHIAHAVVVESSGNIIFQAGDPDFRTCVRSALKPFQAAASVRAGAVAAAGFSPAELALMCGSHNGEKVHVKTARSMLKKLGFREQDYECGRHLPFDRETRQAILRGELELSPCHNNCSGKHAGMLALAKCLEVAPAGYVDRNHPVQKKIMTTVKDYAHLKDLDLAVDGCSAPTPFLSLRVIADLFRQLVAGEDPVLKEVYTAMITHPYLVAGKKRFDTVFMEALNGRAVSKVGGEGVRGIGIQSGEGALWGMAVKILDGNKRVSAPVVMAILEHLHLLEPAEAQKLASYRHPVLKNHRDIDVGRIEVEINP